MVSIAPSVEHTIRINQNIYSFKESYRLESKLGESFKNSYQTMQYIY